MSPVIGVLISHHKCARSHTPLPRSLASQRWETRRLLSGLYDACGARLTITAGAGGTDAMDWAEMVLRMYIRSVSVDRFSVNVCVCERRGNLMLPPMGWGEGCLL